jgi:hypothetical protein
MATVNRKPSLEEEMRKMGKNEDYNSKVRGIIGCDHPKSNFKPDNDKTSKTIWVEAGEGELNADQKADHMIEGIYSSLFDNQTPKSKSPPFEKSQSLVDS